MGSFVRTFEHPHSNTSQRGKAASKGARLCPEDQPQRVTHIESGAKFQPFGAIEPLRLGFATAAVRKFARRATILTDTDRVQLCATSLRSDHASALGKKCSG